ncbi:DUF3466 family protein [Vibrio europaeus]|uniref:DUF3466 family protein n=1 Tax=Vibrio europaeus TaxID=300876 RepID=UPI0018A72592|nr:DUF3466 family protein [Vibrio europaeus]MDC5806680.1 DUF3466 family protein [Vibrio europaeus]MDC5812997.1 DUF3466 family protein [Vibrio europaeus]MDC5824294.1 DUF3466 family protein [Vibrio europaeus]MDC5830049.1 DUF3466 family protein [Vibrio europaeus]MDC5836905.1 DUF3466 family protein [Vibrio europaeus]
MTSKIFKISAVAVTIAASFAANAALYNVYLEAPEGASTDKQTYGVAIAPDTTVCWTGSQCVETNYAIATEVKNFRDGFSYRDEAPFFLPFGWNYLDDNWDGFKRYCRDYLGYADTLCENWATAQYTNGYKKEQDKIFTGSIAYIDTTELYPESAIVNSLKSGKATGNKIDANNGGQPRSQAFSSLNGSTTTILSLTDVGATPQTFKESHAWKTIEDGGIYYTVGSVSTTHNHATSDNNSYAAVWIGNALQEPIAWQGDANNGDSRAHGSARDVIKDGTEMYAVGYNSDGDERFKAAIFKSSDSGVTWNTGTLVDGFRFATEEYVNQTLQAVNNNKKAIGTAKLRRALNGAYSNTLFFVPDVSVATPKYTEFSGSIFFEGANGLAGNINNHNDVVGTVDYEQHAETNGKPRAQRAFIANLGYIDGSSAPIGGQARYLDDLTNGSASTDNNQFRIIQAADINDAGVIAATAYYCAGGFDSTAIDAKCTAGASLAGVKLVPISGRTANDITPRPVTQTTVERQGGSLGILVLTVLGLLGFRRK